METRRLCAQSLHFIVAPSTLRKNMYGVIERCKSLYAQPLHFIGASSILIEICMCNRSLVHKVS